MVKYTLRVHSISPRLPLGQRLGKEDLVAFELLAEEALRVKGCDVVKVEDQLRWDFACNSKGAVSFDEIEPIRVGIPEVCSVRIIT